MNPEWACACGETFGTPEELDDHFREIFTPPDGIAPTANSTPGV